MSPVHLMMNSPKTPLDTFVRHTVSQAASFFASVVSSSFEGIEPGERSIAHFLSINQFRLMQLAALDEDDKPKAYDSRVFVEPLFCSELVPNTYIVSDGTLSLPKHVVPEGFYVPRSFQREIIPSFGSFVFFPSSFREIVPDQSCKDKISPMHIIELTNRDLLSFVGLAMPGDQLVKILMVMGRPKQEKRSPSARAGEKMEPLSQTFSLDNASSGAVVCHTHIDTLQLTVRPDVNLDAIHHIANTKQLREIFINLFDRQNSHMAWCRHVASLLIVQKSSEFHKKSKTMQSLRQEGGHNNRVGEAKKGDSQKLADVPTIGKELVPFSIIMESRAFPHSLVGNRIIGVATYLSRRTSDGVLRHSPSTFIIKHPDASTPGNPNYGLTVQWASNL